MSNMMLNMLISRTRLQGEDTPSEDAVRVDVGSRNFEARRLYVHMSWHEKYLLQSQKLETRACCAAL